VELRTRNQKSFLLKYRLGIAVILLLVAFFIATPLTAARFYLLEDYYNLISSPYSRSVFPFVLEREPAISLYNPAWVNEPFQLTPFANGELQDQSLVQINLEGKLELNFRYGKDFALGNSGVTGAGTAGLSDGFEYDFLQQILLTGSVGERLFIEFDYDSEREEDELGGDRNTYDVTYRGKDDEFLKEVNVGNKELAIKDSRYIKIDDGNADSFALRGVAGKKNLRMEGLFRFNEALQGRKAFSGSRDDVEFDVLDVEYLRRQLFLIPDTGIDESTLVVYRTATGSVDEEIDGKRFVQLSRGRDYAFDNTRGRIYLLNALQSDQELVVFYEKGGAAVGDLPLGQNAIINESGIRTDFNKGAFSDYFDASSTYLYLLKNNLNSYWELRNAYFLDEYEGESLFNIDVELLLTANQGVNDNYNGLLQNYEIDTNLGVIFFNFEDTVGFYPRPFPGLNPYPIENPFSPSNPIYGGLGDPSAENSINTLVISYSYNTDIYFLDFNLIPGSVQVWINGVLLDPKYYSVEYEFGILNFDDGVIRSSDSIEVRYGYTGFGTGEQSLFTAAGFYYDNGPLYAQNLTAYETGLRGQQAPEVGSEGTASLSNATSLKLDFGATDEDEEGLYTTFDGEFAFSKRNNNVYGSAIVADMETEEFSIELNLSDQDWMLGTRSQQLPLLPLSLGTRGNLLYKNYWEEKFLGGQELQTLSWGIPADQVFQYVDKAGPYNTADKPSGGADSSMVLDYEFSAGSSDAYVTVSLPLHNENLSVYERFNMIVQGVDIAGDNVRIFVEILQDYNEDLNGNGDLDGESTINDLGFRITPEDGSSTNIGTDRNGRSNARIDSEDLNEDRIFDTGPETGVVIVGDSTDYIREVSTGSSGWQYVSVDILDLIESQPDIFQSADTLRLTVTAVTPTLMQDAAGKLVINRIWFSGASMVNQSKDFLNINDVSVNADPVVQDNAFSKTFPGVYEELHGDATYRGRNDLIEKTLKVYFSASALEPLTQDSEATVARRFGIPADLSIYRKFSMFLFLPSSQTVPPNMDFTVSFVSSQNEQLRGVVPGAGIVQGWNRIDVQLKPPYGVDLNDVSVDTMTRAGDLRVLNRLAELRFGLLADGGDVTQPLEVWLDEWFVADSESHFDTAFFTEGTFGYRGDVLNLSDFTLVGDPSLLLGFERQEGSFYENDDERSDRLYTGLDVQLLQALGTEIYLSREDITTIRNEEELPGDLSTDDYKTQQSHALELAFENEYIPVLGHSYDRFVTNLKDIQLRTLDYQHSDSTGYEESVQFWEGVDFPFGISQSYRFSRDWTYNNTLERVPSQSMDPTQEQDATVGQKHYFDISYGWQSNVISAYYRQDSFYTGLSVPESEQWGSAYTERLSTLFKPVGQTVEDGVLASTANGYGLSVGIPLVKFMGYNFLFDSDFSEKNFGSNGTDRDTVYNHRFEMSFPFFFLGIDQIEITPLWQREFRGDYRTVSSSLSQGDLFLESYSYLFRPPFYYMGDRANDFDAVNIFNDSEKIGGTTSNTLFNAYILDLVFAYDRWYVPSIITVGVNGETRREGESYRQSRGYLGSLRYNVPLQHASEYFKNNVALTFDYEGNRQFDTKVQNNALSLTTEYNAMKTEFQGVKVYNRIGYTRQRQHIGDESFSLFPDVPDSNTNIAQVAPSDTIENEIRLNYLWQVFPKKKFLSFLKSDPDFRSSFKNEEVLTIENIYTFTNRDQVESFGNIPLRITLEHETKYELTDRLWFTAFYLLMFGLEERVTPDYTSGNLLTSIGFELGAKLEIYF
jgi:hypothetical protein